MRNRSILKVTKFQLHPPKRLGTVVKNILGGHQGPLPCQIGLKVSSLEFEELQVSWEKRLTFSISLGHPKFQTFINFLFML